MKPTTLSPTLYGNFSNDERERFWSITKAPGMMTANVKPKNDVRASFQGIFLKSAESAPFNRSEPPFSAHRPRRLDRISKPYRQTALCASLQDTLTFLLFTSEAAVAPATTYKRKT